VNRFLIVIASVTFFLVLLLTATSQVVGLGFLDVRDSNLIVLKELESIVIEEPIESPKLRKAVADFNALWTCRVGYLLEIEAPSFGKLRGIYLRQSNRLKSKKMGSFSLRKKGKGILVDAWNEEGLANALYYLAHNMLGARWYWPTPLGFEWVGTISDAWRISDRIIEPSFSMRSLYGSDTEYSLRNRLVGGYSFNHNLARIFKPEIQSIIPNIFADLGYRHIKHSGSRSTDPQPNLTHKGAVQLTALAAIHHFKKYPSAKSFSLSPNDNILYDTTEATEKAVSPITYFRKRPNYTDMTFEFANQVAHKVFNEAGLWKTDKGEDRYLGMLAYYWAEQSPSIPLHPRVLPILTSDRSQWQDSRYRQEDKALIERWGKTEAKKIGAWDYYFGAPYPYPRQFTEWISESVPHLHRNRVDVFFSQLPSMWGLDGPKAWLATQLLWDADAEAEDLLIEFYNEFFGDASEAIRAFYEKAESHRNKNEGDANWIKFYLDESGIELFPKSVLEEMRTSIEAAKSMVHPSSRYYQRIQIISEAFELTELYHAYHFARLDLLSYVTDKEATEGIQRVRNLELKRVHFLSRAKELVNNPLHAHFEYFLKLGQTDPIAFSLIPIMRKGESVDQAFQKQYGKLLSIAKDWINTPDSFKTRIGNPSLQASFENAKERDFLGPKIPQIKYWQIDFRPAEALAIEPLSVDGETTKGLRILNADMFQLYTLALLAPQREYLLKAKIKSKISPDCRAQLRLDWINESGVKFESLRMIQLPNGASNGHFELEIPLIAPEAAEKAKISLYVQRQGERDFLEIEEINFLREPKESN
jgi:hypothetical protein